jgi:cell division protein FtsI/penicillin-binding protein 2
MDGQLVGKSSTAESVETIDLDLDLGTNIYNHTWFGGIAYIPKDPFSVAQVFHGPEGNPELVVIVYLRYGAWGKDTVPVAAQVAQKWREIKSKHKLEAL